MSGLFISAMTADATWGAVVEEVDAICWFYLCRMIDGSPKIVDAIHLASGAIPFCENDVRLQWSAADEKAGVFIRDELWAVFDMAAQAKFGGDYAVGKSPSVPPAVAASFTRS